MKKKWIGIVTASLILTAFNPITTLAEEVSQVAQEKTLAESIEEKATLLNSILKGTSMQYAMMSDGEIVLSGQIGSYSRTENKELTSDTMYGIGSISKMYTTASIMKLVEEGKIDLDTPVVNYIPEFKMADERYKEITVRMLLNHSSGLMGSSFQNAFLLDDNDTYAKDNLLKTLETQRLKADPGAYSVYCNDGFTLAEILVERVSGVDFTQFIHTYFTEPLGLSNTKTPMDEFDQSQLAKLYIDYYNGELPAETVNVIGTGGIYSTAEELCKFAQIFSHNGEHSLSQDSLTAMESNEARKGLWVSEGDNTVEYGLGWDNMNLYPFNEYGIKALVKGGDTQLSHGTLIVLPEYNMAAAVVSSGGASTYNQMLASNMLLQELESKGIIDEIKPAKTFQEPVPAQVPNELLDHSGIYMSMAGNYKVSITAEGQLVLKSLSVESPEQTFIYTEEGYFVSPDGSTQVQIVEESNGRAYLWVRSYGYINGIGELVLSEYQLQKAEANEIPEEISKVWEERVSKEYLILNEKYSSQNYFVLPKGGLDTLEELPGYISIYKILDENHAISDIQIPGMYGRDLTDLTFFEEEGIEYLKQGAYIAVEEETIPNLTTSKKAVCTIQDTGYARWYKVPQGLQGKTLEVDIPENGAVMVYGVHDQLIENTHLSQKSEVTLTGAAYIAFVGDAGVRFSYTVK